MVLVFDEGKLFKQYKKMFKVTVQDGYLLPYRISSYPVPSEFMLSNRERDKLFGKMSYTANRSYHQMCSHRRKEELLIFKGLSDYGSVGEFHDGEVKDFLSVYPVFKDIIVLE